MAHVAMYEGGRGGMDGGAHAHTCENQRRRQRPRRRRQVRPRPRPPAPALRQSVVSVRCRKKGRTEISSGKPKVLQKKTPPLSSVAPKLPCALSVPSNSAPLSAISSHYLAKVRKELYDRRELGNFSAVFGHVRTPPRPRALRHQMAIAAAKE